MITTTAKDKTAVNIIPIEYNSFLNLKYPDL